MSEMDKKILDRQVELLKGMDDQEKAVYLAFCEGMLAAKQQGCGREN
jgi:hypothetical protein